PLSGRTPGNGSGGRIRSNRFPAAEAHTKNTNCLLYWSKTPENLFHARCYSCASGVRAMEFGPALDVHIRRLQRGSCSKQYIETVFGMGYRFQPFPAVPRFQPMISDSARHEDRRIFLQAPVNA